MKTISGAYILLCKREADAHVCRAGRQPGWSSRPAYRNLLSDRPSTYAHIQFTTNNVEPAAAVTHSHVTQMAHRPDGEHAASHQSANAPRPVDSAGIRPHYGDQNNTKGAASARRGTDMRRAVTHQIGAHRALCQHERTFRHQENLNVGKTRGLLLAVILLRVAGAALLGADLVFNLHPFWLRLRSGWTASNCTGPVRRRPSG